MVKGRGLTVLKVLGGLIASLMVLIVGTVFLLNTDAFQNKLLKHAIGLLSDKLQTRVEIDSVSIGLLSLWFGCGRPPASKDVTAQSFVC